VTGDVPAIPLTGVKARAAGMGDTAGVMPGIAQLSATYPASRVSPPASRASSVFLPREHGSWSLALEPLALGLLVVPSWAGGALGAAALAGFFARRPFEAAFAPAHSPRRASARSILVLLAALAVAGVVETLVLGEPRALWPLLCAAPLGGLFAYFDSRSESRAAAAELAGSAAFAFVPAAFATLAGWPAPAALALVAVALSRSVPTVLVVRAFLRGRKSGPVNAGLPLLVAGAAVAAAGALAALDLVPVWIPLLPGALLARAVVLLDFPRSTWTARGVGMTEAALGAFFVAVAALIYRVI
jgi:hypothetical protein